MFSAKTTTFDGAPHTVIKFSKRARANNAREKRYVAGFKRRRAGFFCLVFFKRAFRIIEFGHTDAEELTVAYYFI